MRANRDFPEGPLLRSHRAMRERVRVDELMDAPGLDPGAHDLALAGLARLNAWSRSHRLLWPGIAAHARAAQQTGRTLRVVDVATGSGDAPVALAVRARRAGLRVAWTLVDASAHALSVAGGRARDAGVEVELVQADAMAQPLPCEGDVVTCSLFLHHCERADAVRVLRHMAAAARIAVGATDLDRTRGGLALAWLGSRVLSRSPIVHFDATASVRGAFTMKEAASLASEAGLAGATVARAWPARWTLWWSRR